jgi:hypothetical protein
MSGAHRRLLGGALLGLAAALALVAVLGPLVAGAIDWRIGGAPYSQLLGLDAVSLVLVAPLAVIAGVLTLRGRPLGPVLGIGPASYAAYMAPQYVLGPDYLGRPGNNEAFFPLLLALLVLGVVAGVAAWSAMDLDRLPAALRTEAHVARLWLPLAAFVVFSRYLAGLPDLMSASPTAQDYLDGPTFVWTIALLDLGLALPAVIAAVVGFRRGAPWARRALYAVASWLALVGVAVAAMAVVMQVRGDEGASAGQAVVMVAIAAPLVAIAVALVGPLTGRRRGTRRAGLQA